MAKKKLQSPLPPYDRQSLRQQFHEHKGKFIVYFTLRAIVVAALVLSAIRGRYENVATCALTLVLFLLPAFVERNFRVDLPDTLEIIILCFIFAAEILGELACWYVRYTGWDTLMHTINGFMAAAIGFPLVDLFNRNKRFQLELSPLFLALVAFCFSMTIGILWEFFEFAMDYFFQTDMQKDTVLHVISSVKLDPANSNTPIVIRDITDTSINGQSLGLGGYLDIGLYDTMKDLFVNFIGAVVFSVIGFFYVRSRGKQKFAKHFIPVVEQDAAPTDRAPNEGPGASV